MLHDLLEQKLSRREFLSYVAAAMLAMTGIAGMLKSLQGGDLGKSQKTQSFGYGHSPYGGVKTLK